MALKTFVSDNLSTLASTEGWTNISNKDISVFFPVY